MAEPLAGILERIVAQRRQRFGVDVSLEGHAGTAPEPELDQPALPRTESPILEAIAGQSGRAIIAEVKMGSPRLGSLVGRVDPERQARLYRRAGAVALSVVVEPDFFHGSYELLAACKAASGLPALAKDFVVSPRQLDRAAECGADAVLLIAALYGRQELRLWAAAARARGLVPLIETHDAGEVERLADADWELVGINNRDLRTFEVDLEHSIELRPSLPAGALAVAESGIASARDRQRLAAAGFDGFLIGEALLLADDPAAKLEELLAD